MVTAPTTTRSEVGGGRLLLIPLESRGGRLVVLVLTLGLAAGLAYLIVRPAVAASLAARSRSTADLQRALAWDPTNPSLHRQLARAHEDLGDSAGARAHFETAQRLRPTDAYPWLELAILFDKQGEQAQARSALTTALRLDPHDVTIRREAALLALRWGDREEALGHLRYLLAVDPAQRDAAFHLARLLLNPKDDPEKLLPSEPRTVKNVLMAAVNNQDATLAGVAWSRLVSLQPSVPPDVGRRYLDFLLTEGDGSGARRVWRSLVPNPRSAGTESLVWNGGFENERLMGWGFDWHVARVWGVDVSLDRFVAARGRHSLRLTFNSFPTLNFAGVWQLVGVEAGREYRLRALARASAFTTRSGVKLQVALPKEDRVLAETTSIAGTTDWVPLEATVRIPSGTSLVVLRLRREPAAVPEGNLGGKVWLDEVSLQ
jgi:tetratricopeptide (TPR) repeat protein